MNKVQLTFQWHWKTLGSKSVNTRFPGTNR